MYRVCEEPNHVIADSHLIIIMLITYDRVIVVLSNLLGINFRHIIDRRYPLGNLTFYTN